MRYFPVLHYTTCRPVAGSSSSCRSSAASQLRDYVALQSHPVAVAVPGVELALDDEIGRTRKRREQRPRHRRAPALAVTTPAVVDHGHPSVAEHALHVGEI